MEATDHITFRAGDELKGRIDDLADRYGMDRSKLLRLLLGHAVDDVEADGLDEFVSSDESDAREQPAD